MPDLVVHLEAEGIEVLRHPIVDMSIPDDLDEYQATLAKVTARLRESRAVAVACRGGLGRTGTTVACILVDAGLDADAAIALTRATRRNTIERGCQVELVEGWARISTGQAGVLHAPR